MIGEMTVKKETVIRNDRLRKQERLGYRFGLLVVLNRGAKGRAPIKVVGHGCLLIRVVSLDAKVEDGKSVTRIKED